MPHTVLLRLTTLLHKWSLLTHRNFYPCPSCASAPQAPILPLRVWMLLFAAAAGISFHMKLLAVLLLCGAALAAAQGVPQAIDPAGTGGSCFQPPTCETPPGDACLFALRVCCSNTHMYV